MGWVVPTDRLVVKSAALVAGDPDAHQDAADRLVRRAGEADVVLDDRRDGEEEATALGDRLADLVRAAHRRGIEHEAELGPGAEGADLERALDRLELEQVEAGAEVAPG